MSENVVKRGTAGKIFSAIWRGFLIILIAFLTVIAVTLAYDKLVNKTRIPSVFGYSLLVIATPSMSGAIETGDAIIIQRADSYEVGDVITYFPAEADYSVTHRIVRADGEKFYTKGDANPSEDPDPVFAEQIAGRVTKIIPKVGYFIEWLKSPSGIVFVIAFAGIIVAIVVLESKWKTASEK